MTTETTARRSRVKPLVLGIALALGAPAASAFPFFQATNGGASTTFGTPSFGLALNNAFDPVVLYISFDDVAVRLNADEDLNGNELFDPEEAVRLRAEGDVSFTYGFLVTTQAEADDKGVAIGTFLPDGDAGTGSIRLDLEGLEYDADGNFFFINGPAHPDDPGEAFGFIDIETVSGDLMSTPLFDETRQCINTFPHADSGLSPPNLPDTFCSINLGLNGDNDTPQVVKFFLNQPILEEDLVTLDCFLPFPGADAEICIDGAEGFGGFSTASFVPAATDPTGQIIGMFDHGACDPEDPTNSGFDPSSGRTDCEHYYGQPTTVGPAGKFSTFTPNRVSAPASLALLGLGLALAGGARRRLA